MEGWYAVRPGFGKIVGSRKSAGVGTGNMQRGGKELTFSVAGSLDFFHGGHDNRHREALTTVPGISGLLSLGNPFAVPASETVVVLQHEFHFLFSE